MTHDPIFTLENPWMGNKRMISCIPEGIYICNKFTGNKYKDVFQVNNVPGRDAILFHSGNHEKDTHGCILVGLSAGAKDGNPRILQSRDALAYFKSLVGDSFHLTII